MKKRIGDLPANPAASAIYRRDDGKTFIRLNDSFHVEGYEKNGSWFGNGTAEMLDLNEEVEVIRPV